MKSNNSSRLGVNVNKTVFSVLLLTALIVSGFFVAGNALAAVGQRGIATSGTATGTSLIISKPAGVVAGDVLIANIAQAGSGGGGLSNPSSSGWTLIAGADLAGGTHRWGAVFYKVAGASEPATYTFTLDSDGNSAVGGIVAFSGVNISGSIPFDVTPGTITVGGSGATTATATATTTVSSNAAVIMLTEAAGNYPSWSGWTTTSPGALSEILDSQYSVGSQVSIGAAWALKSIAGSTGTGSVSLSTGERNGGILIALKPKTDTTLSITNSPVTYTGFPQSATVTGSVGGVVSDIKYNGSSTVPTNAGTYAVTADFVPTDTDNYNSLSDASAGNFVINKANAVISVTSYSVAYDGVSHTAAGTATGVIGEDLSAGLNLSGTTHTNTGIYNGDAWSFAGGTNYNDENSTVDDSISKADLTVTAVTDTKVYDGNTTSTGLPNLTSGTLAGGDSAVWSQTFDNKNVGTGKTLTPAGTVSDGNGGNNYNVTFVPDTTGIITEKSLTASIAGVNKIYDGNTDATVTPSTDAIGGDDVSVNGTASFDNKNVGADKPIEMIGMSLTGADAGNYTLSNTSASTTADITHKDLTVSATADGKTYDGTDSAVAYLATDAVLGDEVIVSYTTASFDNRNAGAGKTVHVSGISLDGGADAGNYALGNTSADAVPVEIVALSLTGNITADNKSYDGNTSATIATRTLTGVIEGDDVSYSGGTATFDNKNVGVGKIVTGTGLSLSGTDAGNYTVNDTATTTADITTATSPLTVTANGVNKIYDGNTNATVILTTDAVEGDEVTASGSATFDTKDVGVGKIVSVTGIVLTGADAGNYTLSNTSASTTADITARSLTVTADAKNKFYGAVDPELTWTVTDGALVEGDSLSGMLARDEGEAVGSYPITQGTLAADGNYSLGYAGADLTIGKAVPEITWTNPADITYPEALSATQLNAIASVEGEFTYNPISGTVLGAGNGQLLAVHFVPNDTVNYDETDATVYINVLKATPVITWDDPQEMSAGTALDINQLNAGANVDGEFVYTPSAGTIITVAGDQTLSVHFTPNDSDNYNETDDTAILHVVPTEMVSLNLMASPTNLAFDQTSQITVTGKDQYDNTVTNNNSATVVFSADGGGSLDNTILTLTSGSANANLSKDSVGVVHVTTSSEGLTPKQVTVTFTEVDTSRPYVESHTPADGAEDVALNVHPVLVFSEPLDTTTVSSDNIQLRKYSDDSVISASVSPAEGDRQVVITPANPLDFSTQYYLSVSSDVKDKVGNLAMLFDKEDEGNSFATLADNTVYGVTQVTAVKTSATPDDTYENGWKWVFSVTVPVTETQLQMKFSDWTGIAGNIPAANNVRYYSAQSSDSNSAETAKTVTEANVYADAMNLTSDLDTIASGRQIQITVEAKVPVGSAGGSYSNSYGIKSLNPIE